MKLTYSVIYFALIFALVGCTVFAKRSSRPSRGAVAWVETSLIIPILGNLIIVLSDIGIITLIGHYLYFLGVNSVLLALVNFTNVHCTGIGNGTQKPTVMYILLFVDTVQLLLNPIFEHAFVLETVTDNGNTSFIITAGFGRTFHRIIDYVIMISVILIFALASVRTPRIYRDRFTVLLFSMTAIALMQTYYIFSESNYDRPVIAYGFFGLVLFYFAIIYRPLRLLDQMLSSIVSDLSDAFYVFDASGRCVWANEQGCKLVGYSGTNYEEVNAELIGMFGSPSESEERISRVAVGTGENIRFFSLVEKQVKGPNGKYNGSYLRIRDVTVEEHALQDRDKRIGLISQEAYKDALTGVGNIASYNNKVAEINQQLENGPVEFAVVMVDMNDLKQINDQCGHKEGDIYIKGCCQMICDAFKHSPVFRIGGDEFVVILRGQDYTARHQNVKALRAAFEDSFEQTEKDPWFRYSASVGLSESSSADKTFEQVFKRANQAMSNEKKMFKFLNGRYRS